MKPARTFGALGLVGVLLGSAAEGVSAPPAPVPAPTPSQAAPTAAPAAPPAVAPATFEPGCFLGEVAQGPNKLLVRLCLEQSAGWIATGSLIQAGVINQHCTDVSVSGNQVACTLDARGTPGTFEGEVSADGVSFRGVLTLKAKGQPPSRLPFELHRWIDPTSSANCLRVTGEIKTPGGGIPIVIALAEVPPPIGPVATIDILQQGVSAWPMLVKKLATGAYQLTLAAGSPATFTLAVAPDAALVGMFEQSGFKTEIRLTALTGAEATGAARPQDPQPPFPYEITEVRVSHPAAPIQLAGTFTMPPHAVDEKLPAVVLIAGSGPQNRDEAIMGHRTFAVLADAITRAGFAVIRLDKRGIGASSGEFSTATTFDFATDADAATEWLKSQSNIDPDRIGLIGHSEGATCAAIVARWQWEETPPIHPVAFLVLLGAPGRPGHEIMRWQNDRIMQAENIPAAARESIDKLQGALLDAAIAKEAPEALQAKALELIKAQAVLSGSEELVAQSAADEASQAVVAQILSNWMSLFLTYDPRTAMSAVPCPVLAIAGTLDTQVDAQVDLSNVEAALKHGGSSTTIVRREGLNHLLQPAKTGSPSEYATIETTFDPATIEIIIDWIKARVKK
ncbi:MAG: alpha/beta fold hydrolase [Phycisphaerales bacterium]|nr:alpha/beta fold hydrolase [Phycisphaerales bacterium]